MKRLINNENDEDLCDLHAAEKLAGFLEGKVRE